MQNFFGGITEQLFSSMIPRADLTVCRHGVGRIRSMLEQSEQLRFQHSFLVPHAQR
jgi:hypothetical protein